MEPEIYETSDVESIRLFEKTPAEGPDIDLSALEVELARTEFNALRTTPDVDFSGAIHKPDPNATGYRIAPWLETRLQKVARLQREIAELASESEQEKTEAEQLKSALLLTVDRGGWGGYNVDIENALRGLVPESVEAASTNDTLANSTTLQLDQRLQAMELALEGLSGTGLAATVQDLARKVDVLYDPKHELGVLREQVTSLHKELEQMALSKRMAQLALGENVPKRKTMPFEEKVDAIYSRLAETEDARTKLPATIVRLKSLHQVHMDILSTVATVGALDEAMLAMKTDMDSWNSSLDSFSQALDVLEKQFEADKAAMGERLATLDSRLQSIEDARQR